MGVKCDIIVRNTHFVVTPRTKRINKVISKFNANLITYKLIYSPQIKRMKSVEDRKFYYTVGRSTHYSIHLLTTFISRALGAGYKRHDFNVSYDTKYTPAILEAELRDGYSDREHQPVYIDKIHSTNPVTLVDLPTGKGKTYISMRVTTDLRAPTGIVVLSRYIDKWISDVEELTTVESDKIYVVKGIDSMTRLLASDEQYDFVIFSLSTLRNYIKNCDEGKYQNPVKPEEVFKKLGLGIMLCDEVHQSFHAGYMCALRLNPAKLISLSATLDTLDPGIRAMYNTLYPKEARCGELVKFEPHPIVVAVNHRVNNPNRINCVGPRGYNHSLFEQSVFKNRFYRDTYLGIILKYVHKGYLKRKRAGDKLLILVQTVKMASLITGYLRSKLSGVVVNRYIEEDPYENILEADITVSTNMSAGTALDIPNLITVIQCVSMGSLQANVQALGRLRKINGIDVTYYYLYSSNLKDQKRLHLIRKGVIGKLAKEYRYEEYGCIG